jgi:hypothetical protein
MRVLLKEILDCDPDAAWRAIRSPAVLREVSSPVFAMESLGEAGFPTVWEPGEHRVALRGLGLMPVGEQVIRLSTSTRQHGGVRILRDSGRGVSGSLGAIRRWDHRMAISPDPAGTGKTLYRDQLIFSAGPATLAAWPALWSFWQWRMQQLKRLAPSWRFDVGVDSPDWAGPDPDAAAGTEQSDGHQRGGTSAAE